MLSLTTVGADAYDPVSHVALSLEAVRTSVLGNSAWLEKLGISRTLEDDRQKFANEKGQLRTLMNLVGDGAAFEDEGGKSLNHFFNPRTGAGLTLNPGDFILPTDGLPVQSAIILGVTAANAEALPSPDWALGDHTGIYLSNAFAHKNAKLQFFRAFTTLDNVDRAAYVGELFQSLGHIIHHIEDMAQPQHVRNDAHLQHDGIDTSCDAGKSSALFVALCPVYKRVRTPSTYEAWTTHVQSLQGYLLPLSGYGEVYGGTSMDTATFSDARDFWTNSGKGMADFTNRNFFSVGTMDVTPPMRGPRYAVRAAELCSAAVPACGAYHPDDVVLFYSSAVDDQLRPTAGGAHPYAASDSIFDPDLRRFNSTQPLPTTVNRFTFAGNHAYLLPRAVGYSAGFINYFFRGDMKITPPDEGIYAIVDHSAGGCGNPCGFRKIKLKVKNTTVGNEVMGAGSLWAVAKYHLNACYQPDLSGEYGGPAFGGDKCRSAEESISVSAPIVVPSLGRSDAQPFAFDFAASPVPINVSDVSLQVVFRGRLGSEDDAVAVTTEDISEPNFYALTNVSDFVFDTGFQKYYPLGYKNYLYPNVVTNVRFAFGQNRATTSATAVATLNRLGGGDHAQFAVLMPRNQVLASTEWDGDYDAPGELYAWDTQEFSQDDGGPNAGQYTRTCPVHPIRGMYRQYGLFFVQQSLTHGASSLKDKEVLPAIGQASTSTAKPSRTNPKAAVAANCAPWPTTGYYDFTAMPKLTPATAVPWQIRF